MSVRKVAFAHGEYFHIYNRGNSKQDVFLDNVDRHRFQALLFLANGTTPFTFRRVEEDGIYTFERGDQLVYLGAYCLMPNHFHLLLTPAVEGGIQAFMQKLLTGYSMYFNRRHERTGVLYEGKFKARHANSDEYLKYLFSYIHLNPVKLIQHDWKEVGIRDLDKTRKYLAGYKFSSLHDYLGNREESCVIDKEKFPQYFSNKTEIDAELIEWLTFRTLVEKMEKHAEARPM